MSRLADLFYRAFRKVALFVEKPFDHRFLDPQVPLSEQAGYQCWQNNLRDLADRPGWRILEIGSRVVTGNRPARESLEKAEYVGFDYHPGPNVDVVGDAHRLSSYFAEGEQFDLIYSSACFEHFAMPWKVSREIARLLKVGGYVFVETHFAFSSHERPWHFFHFSDLGLKALFPAAMGFECIEAGMSNPIVGRFSSLAAPGMRNKPLRGLYCHTEYLGRKVAEVAEFSWEEVDLDSLVEGTSYPAP